VGDPGVVLRLVLAQPQQLGRREAGQRAVAGQLDEPVEADAFLDLGAFLAGALVVPEDRRPDGAVGGVERDQPVHLPREPDPGDAVGQPFERLLGGLPPVIGVLLRPPGTRCRERVRHLPALENLAVLRDGDDFYRGRADVDPDRHT
jgi:hypothetical protein